MRGERNGGDLQKASGLRVDGGDSLAFGWRPLVDELAAGAVVRGWVGRVNRLSRC